MQPPNSSSKLAAALRKPWANPALQTSDSSSGMSRDQSAFLNLRRLPFVLNLEQAGWRLGIPKDLVSRLIAVGILPACGYAKDDQEKGGKNRVKVVSTAVLEHLGCDPHWLDEIIKFKYHIWYVKNHDLPAEAAAKPHKKKKVRCFGSSPLDTPYTAHTDLPGV